MQGKTIGAKTVPEETITNRLEVLYAVLSDVSGNLFAIESKVCGNYPIEAGTGYATNSGGNGMGEKLEVLISMARDADQTGVKILREL